MARTLRLARQTGRSRSGATRSRRTPLSARVQRAAHWLNEARATYVAGANGGLCVEGGPPKECRSVQRAAQLARESRQRAEAKPRAFVASWVGLENDIATWNHRTRMAMHRLVVARRDG